MISAIAGLTLASSCSMLNAKDHHKCGAKNGCKSKSAEDSHKCAATKSEAESNNCGAKNGCAASKAKSESKTKTAKKVKGKKAATKN